MNPLSLIAGPLVDLGKSWVQGRQQRKAQERQLEHEKHMKKIEYVREGRIAEVEWNKKAMDQSGWKDEYLTVILSAPLVLVFFPGLVPYIEEGFRVLDTTPAWYRAAVAVMIGAAFGYRKYADWQMNKHYTLPDPMRTIDGKPDDKG